MDRKRDDYNDDGTLVWYISQMVLQFMCHAVWVPVAYFRIDLWSNFVLLNFFLVSLKIL